MRKFRIVALIAIVVLGLFGASMARQKRHVVRTTEEIQAQDGIPVKTAPVSLGDIAEELEVTGDIKALRTATLSAKVSGKVVSVSSREGDRVSAGATVVQLDQEDALSAVQQARAGLQSAQARLSQAQTAAKVQTTQSSASIQQARAVLTAAKAQLDLVKKGARSQERLIAESGVATAKANLDNAEANLRRHKTLFDSGAIAAAQLDVAKTQYNVAKAQHDAARQQLSLVKEGARSEEIRQAETQVQQAEEALRMARANAAQNELRKEDIRAAQAGVTQARAALSMAEQQVANTRVTSPIDGYISSRTTEPGQMANPGVPLAEVVDVSTMYFEAAVSETSLSRVKAGQQVRVTIDAFSDRTFMGRVERVYPAASTQNRSFRARIAVPNPGGELRPGMFARGKIQLDTHKDVMLVPPDAVQQRNGQQLIFSISNNNTIRSHNILRGLANGELVEIQESDGLTTKDKVVVSGHEQLKDGTKVYVVN